MNREFIEDSGSSLLKENQTFIGVLNPYDNKEKINDLVKKNINAFSLELLPRITNWIAANPARRGDFILATKHSGEGMAHVRDGAPISAATIAETSEGNLCRLKTDYIDLYQFH